MGFDLDACLAEADDSEPFPFTFGGEEFVLPHPDDVGITALAAPSAADGLRRMLGVEQWSRLEALDKPFTQRHFEALAQQYRDHYQVDLGESEASTTS